MQIIIRTLCCALLASLPLLGHAGSPPDVTASNPWMRYLLPSIPAGGYLVLTNSGDAEAVITAAASPACGMLMLHQSEDSSGMSMMMDVSSVTVPAHGSVRFAPGGFHLMCMQPKMNVGEHVPVTLTFEDGSKLSLDMPVYGATDSP
jgi:copper(I)-binding protein